MPSLHDRLRLLQKEPPQAAAAFLAAALPHAEPEEAEALCAAAVATGRPAALAAVIGRLDRLGSHAMEQLCAAPVSLEPALWLVRRRGSRQAVLNAVAVARRRGDLELLGHLVGLLGASSDEIRQRAGEALLAVVIDHVGPDGRRPIDPDAARRIDDAVAAAVRPGRRRRLDEVVLAAAVLAGRPGGGLISVLADPEHPVLYLLRGVVARTESRLVRLNMLRWLTDGLLGGQVQRRMHRIRGPHQLADLLDAGHLLLSPPRRRAMRCVDRATRLLPGPVEATALPMSAQVSLVRLISALPLPTPKRREHLADCVALPCSMARLQALLGLLGDGSEVSERVVDRLCFDRSRPIAVVASRQVFHRPAGPGPDLLRRLERSPHRVVARRAIAAAAAEGTGAFFDRLGRLSQADRIAAALVLLGAQRDAFLAKLHEVLATGRRSEKLAAIWLGRRLGLTSELEAGLMRQGAATDVRVASAAVAALGDGGSDRRIDAVRAALDHPDARVRANAVEALMRIDRRWGGAFGEVAESRDNRLRANAVRAMLAARAPAGQAALRSMLADADPRHRVSAVWVARRARVGPVAGELRGLADRDRFTEVRTRAAAACRLLGRQAQGVETT
jgi:HEAT repeat protein